MKSRKWVTEINKKHFRTVNTLTGLKLPAPVRIGKKCDCFTISALRSHSNQLVWARSLPESKHLEPYRPKHPISCLDIWCICSNYTKNTTGLGYGPFCLRNWTVSETIACLFRFIRCEKYQMNDSVGKSTTIASLFRRHSAIAVFNVIRCKYLMTRRYCLLTRFWPWITRYYSNMIR